jgi:tetratricopeptide (TPR) repeat protein
LSRFEHLEFGEARPAPTEEGVPDVGVIDQDYYLAKAVQAFDDENYERALLYFSRVLEYDARLEEAWFGQVRCLIGLGELNEAVVWADRALERFPNSARLLAAKAVAEARLQHQKSALGLSDAAQAAPGDWPYLWVARGEALISMNLSSAKACFVKAIEMSPQDWAVRAWIAQAYVVRGCYHQALDHLRIAVHLDAGRSACWYWIGVCHEALGDRIEARMAYQRSLAAEATSARARRAIRRLENQGLLSRFTGGLRRMIHRRRTTGV